MFLDNEGLMEIPCTRDMDDRRLVQHIREFYYLKKCGRGLIEIFGIKSLELVEVVQV